MDNFTKMLSVLALNFENVNTTAHTEDGHFSLAADAKTVSHEGLVALHAAAEETGAIYEIRGGQMLVLGQGILR